MKKQKVFTVVSLLFLGITFVYSNKQNTLNIPLPQPAQISVDFNPSAEQYFAGVFVQGIILPDKPDEPIKDQYSEQQISLMLSYQ